MRVRATNKGLSFVLSAQSSIPNTITTDAVRLKQVLLNLVGNAIKFTDAGEVRIVAQMSSNDSSEPRLEVLVKDTGMGISKDELARLFAPFTQVESNAARAQGTGLGLYLARTLARMMGGDVTVESTLGKGSTFTLMLPIADSDCIAKPSSVDPPSDSHGTEEARLDGLRVLLAEDSVDNQRLISLFLTTAGATVDVVGNGLLVLERVHDAKDHYDVVLMDMEMPELDGYGATARLRALGYRVPVIALTAHAMATHHGRSQAAGCDAHVTKPVDRENLIQVVEQQARKHQDAFATTGYDPRPSG